MINLIGIREMGQRLWDIHYICIIYILFFEDYALINQEIVLSRKYENYVHSKEAPTVTCIIVTVGSILGGRGM